MKTLTTFIQRRPLPFYFVLAYAFAWIFYPLIAISPLYGLPGLFAPALAAIIVTWATGSRPEVGRLLRKLAIWSERTRPRINQAQDLNGLPLAVLSVTEQAHNAEVLTSLQSELPALSTNSVHYTVEGATHFSLVSEREHALVVVEAVRQVLEAAQTHRPL
jgi:hypothetical protein